MVIFYHDGMYYFSVSDNQGYTHSIDNVVIDYYMTCSVPFAVQHLHDLGSTRKGYWEKLDCSGCPKWSFYQNHLHYDDGIYLKIGHWSDYDHSKKLFRLLPMLCLEVNPNKHHDKDSFREVLDFIRNNCTSGTLIRYDYAIDIPKKPDDVQVFKTRKQYGLYKGTRYFGVRNNHGYCRIYDKAKELGLDTPLTRVEHVCSVGKKLSLETFHVLTGETIDDLSGLTPNNRVIVMMARQIKALGGDYSDAIGTMERHARAKLEQYLSGGFVQYQYDQQNLDQLLEKMYELFQLGKYERDPDPDPREITLDDNGFMQYDGDNPFE